MLIQKTKINKIFRQNQLFMDQLAYQTQDERWPWTFNIMLNILLLMEEWRKGYQGRSTLYYALKPRKLKERAKDEAQRQTQIKEYPQEEMIPKIEIVCTEMKESEESALK